VLLDRESDFSSESGMLTLLNAGDLSQNVENLGVCRNNVKAFQVIFMLRERTKTSYQYLFHSPAFLSLSFHPLQNVMQFFN
jgi:hypothetical protein